MKCLTVWLIGFVRSPIISHNWAMVWTPTRSMTKRPTNLTEKAQPKKAPVMLNHVHHSGVNSAWLKFLNLAIAKVAPDMKNIRIGSRRMYWFKVIIPTSEIDKVLRLNSIPINLNEWYLPNKTNAPATFDAVTDFVNSHTVRYVNGTKHAPSRVQACKWVKISHFLSGE